MDLKALKNILPNLMLIFEVVEDFPILPHLTLVQLEATHRCIRAIVDDCRFA